MSTDDGTGATPGESTGTGGTPGGTPGEGAGGYGAAPPPPGGYGSYGGTPGGAPPPYPPGGYGSYGYPQPEPYSPGAAIGYGWRKFWQNAGPILLAVLAIFVAEIILNLIVGAISGALGGGATFTFGTGTTGPATNAAQLVTSFVFSVVGFVISFAIQAAIIRASLDITYGRPVRLDTMVQGLNLGQVLIAGLVIGVAATVGLALCILPGLVVWFLTAYSLYFVVDKDMPAIEAIRASINLVSSNVGVLLAFFLLAFLVYLLGAIACLVGLLVAMPVVLIAQAYTYRVLQGESVAA